MKRLFAAILALLIAGVVMVKWRQRPESTWPGIKRTLARQRQLRPPALKAVQALRLIGAVQFAFLSAEHRYGRPEELKQKGYLDPQWPRVDSTYRVTCEAGAEEFTCNAEPSSGDLPWFRSDATQSIRWRLGGRPDLSSPVFE